MGAGRGEHRAGADVELAVVPGAGHGAILKLTFIGERGLAVRAGVIGDVVRAVDEVHRKRRVAEYLALEHLLIGNIVDAAQPDFHDRNLLIDSVAADFMRRCRTADCASR